jgi:probable F420-dependent oxidoreductase
MTEQVLGLQSGEEEVAAVKIDTVILEKSLQASGELARSAEAAGHDAVWATESGADPFLQAAALAATTDRLTVGTAIAVALARTPMTVAYSAWNLADVTGGRFVLGLGSQVKAHIERRYSMPWVKPVEQMREFVLATRAIFHSWSTGSRLDHRGTYYTHTLMDPFWVPNHHEHRIPICIAAVGPRMLETAGELCDGVLMHAFMNRPYFDSVALPALQRGLSASGRDIAEFDISVPIFMIMGDTDAEIEEQRRKVAHQLAFYASTPAYRPVLAAIGYEDLQSDLAALVARKEWDQLGSLITDDLLKHFAVMGRPEEMPALSREHLGPAVTRTSSYFGWPIVDRIRLQSVLQDYQRMEGQG